MRPEHWKLITELAAVQHGLVTRAQVECVGASPRTLDRALLRGLLVRVRRRVYRIRGVPRDVWEQLMAACLAGSPDAVASHRAAGALHGFPGLLPGAVEVTTPRTTKRVLAGVSCHTSVALPPEDTTVVQGIPATCPARTIVDLASVVDARLLGRMLDSAIRRGQVSVPELGATVERLGGTGRAGSALVRILFAQRDRTDSPLESSWLRRLRRFGLPEPTLQHQVVGAGGVMVLDFAWPEQRVGVEVDGWEPHRTRTAWDRDHEKANAYAEAGWRVLYVTSRTPIHDAVRQLRRLLSE